ncbi:DedA family protein [Pseudoroseomonas deserti]|uniref:DedA family protein n=1 Tax=Teichococcus deserti TaxID=1817963 RepID=A0A1V2H426_9PROT|nr:DedA family protein [Pseudoroseomonas deserti]ONG54707.1 DedA family protein [Pseudoroseomonas deserti]
MTETLLAWVEAHAAWAPAAVFALAFAESLPLLGFFVPGSAILLGVGVLIALDALPVLPVMLAAMAGAALGDSSGFLLVRWLGRGAARRCLPARGRRLQARSVLIFRRWGWWAVFLSRFFAPLRAFVPVIAGLSGMSMARFQSANIPSAILWAPVVLLPGQIAAWAAGALDGPALLAGLAILLAATGFFLVRGRRTA